MEKKKIVIAGGTGFLGSLMIDHWKRSDMELVVLTRKMIPSHDNVRYVSWDAETEDTWTKEIDGAFAVINLTGKSVNCRYTEQNKKEIINSRVYSTLVLGKAIKKCTRPPKVWINAGSAAIFGDAGNQIKDETSVIGDGFSSDVCKLWEKAFYAIDTHTTRKVFLRIGMVLQTNGGVLKPFMNLAKAGLGGRLGSGKQYITWIHEHDFINLIEYALDHEEIKDIIHAAAPNPVTNAEFMKEIRQASHCSIGLPNPDLLIRIGAVFIGTEAELVLTGRRVVSKVLTGKNFRFKFPEIRIALADLIK